MERLNWRALYAPDRSWLFAALTGLVVLAFLWMVSAPSPEILFSDFNEAYFPAALMLHDYGAVPTWPFDKPCTEGFVNIPILGWLFVPLVPLGYDWADWTFFAFGLAGVSAAFVLLLRLCRPQTRCGPLLLFLFLVNGPLVHSFREGNLTHIVLLLLIVTLLLWRSGFEFAAGVLLGFAAVIKMPLLLLGAYFALRGRWRIVGGGLACISVIGIASLIVFGPELNFAWYDACVGAYLGRIMPGFNAQSLDAFLFRLVDGDDHLQVWTLIDPTRGHQIARACILGVLAGGLLLLMWRAERLEPAPRVNGTLSGRDMLEFVLVTVLAIVISPLSWSHYYLLLLLPWGLYFGGMLPLRDDRITKGLIWVSIVSFMIPVLMLPEDLGRLGPFFARTFISAYFIGGMLTLLALARGAWQASVLPAGHVRPKAGPSFRRLADRLTAPVRLMLPKFRERLSDSERVTRGLALFTLAVLLLDVALWLVSGESAISHTAAFFTWVSDDDSWGPMTQALYYFESEYFGPQYSKPIYTEMVFNRGFKFQYPPTSLFFFALLRAVDVFTGRLQAGVDSVSFALVLAGVLCTAIIFEIGFRRLYPSAREDKLTWFRTILLVLLGLTFYPVVKAFTLGQIQAWINGIFALALLFWIRSRRIPAGALIGVIAMIKPQYGIVLAWGMLRREWRFVIAGAVVVALGFGLSLYVFGWDNHIDYLRLLGHLSRVGEAYYPNQSLNGLLNRLMSLFDPVNYNNLEWSSATFPPFNAWVYGGTLGSSLIFLGLALFRRRGRDEADGTIDLCIVALGCTIASPIAWEHHYGILLPIYAVLLVDCLNDRRRLLWLGASYILVSNYFSFTKLLAATPLNILQSYLFAGALIALALLLQRPAQQRALQSVPPDGALTAKAGAG